MRRVFFSVLLALFPLTPAGCSEDSSGGGSGVVSGAPIAQQDFAEVFSREFCHTLAGCCQAGQFPFDEAQCKASLRSQMAESVAKANQDGLVYNEQAAGNCVAAYQDLVSACKLGRDDDPVDLACNEVFRGTLSRGETCAQTRQCATGLRCEVRPDLGTTTCASPQAPRAAGETCVSTAPDGLAMNIESCVEGYACDVAGKKCVERLGEGQACDTVPCQEALYCDYSSGKPTCRRAAAQGEPCSASSSMLPPCATPLRCDEATRTCLSRVRPFTAETCSEEIHL